MRPSLALLFAAILASSACASDPGSDGDNPSLALAETRLTGVVGERDSDAFLRTEDGRIYRLEGKLVGLLRDFYRGRSVTLIGSIEEAADEDTIGRFRVKQMRTTIQGE